MNRAQAQANLESLGFTDVTDEQITNYLNQLQGETKKYSDRADKLKADAEKVAELQAKLDEISNQNLTDIEKAQKETETANSKVAELEAKMKSMELKTSLAEKGIVGEQAEKLIESISGGSLDVEVLGQIIAEREQASASAKELEIANNSTNPNGNNDSGAGEKDKPADVINAESMSGLFGKQIDNSTKDYYKL